MKKQEVRHFVETIYNFEFNLFRPFSMFESAFAAAAIQTAEEAELFLNEKFNIPEFSSQFVSIVNKEQLVKKDLDEALQLIFQYLL